VTRLAIIIIATAALLATAPRDAGAQSQGDAEPELDPAIAALAAAEEAKANEEVIEVSGEAPVVVDDTRFELTGEQVRTLPGSGNDTLKALQSLPSAARVPFGLGGLVLRGSSPRDTSVYLDDIRVPILYHFGGLASFFPSTMLKSMELVPGGFGSPYGRSQGGLVLLETRPGRTDRWRVGSEVSLLDAQARADGPALGGSVSVGVRRSYVDGILALAVPEDSDLQLTLAPRYYDAQVRYQRTLRPGETLSAIVFGADDRIQLLAGDEQDTFRFQQSFIRAGLGYKRYLGKLELKANAWIGADKSSVTVTDNFVTRSSVPMGGRASLLRAFGSGYLAGGIDVQGGRNSYDAFNEAPPRPDMPPISNSDEDAIARAAANWFSDVGVWLEGMYSVDGGRFALKPGLRLDRLGLTGEWVFNPRLTAVQKLSDSFELRQSAGIYHQPPVPADLDPVSGNPDLMSSKSYQLTVGAAARLPAGVEASATAYYEDMRDVAVDAVTTATPLSSSALGGGAQAASVELTSEQFGTYSYQENRGRGRNYGVELIAKRMRGAVSGWLAYTYSRALRRDDPRRFLEYRPYVLDQPHALTGLVSWRINDEWSLGTRVRYASGNPFTPVVGSYYDSDEQEYTAVDGEVLSERLPAFLQIDLRADRRWKRDWGTLRLFIDIQNVTNRTNPEGVDYNFDYSRRDYTRGLPFFPSIGLELQT
jgi:hypothetical protein